MKLLNYVMGLAVAVALTACGGGGGNPGTVSGGTGGTKVAVSDFLFQLDKTSIVNTGSDETMLTLTVLDKNRNILADIPVEVSVDAEGVFVASASKTDAFGKLTGTITIGSNKGNRTINATIKVNDVTKVASILVTGSRIIVTAIPATPAPGQTVTLNISALDNAGGAIPNEKLTLSGTLGAVGTVTTDLSGSQVATVIAPLSPNTYTVVVTGLGVSTTTSIQVVVPGETSMPDVLVPLSASSLSPQPSSISPNVAGVTSSRSKLSAKFLTTGNVGIQYMRVRFLIVPPALGSGEMISVGNATIYTDASGLAEVDYIAGTRSSPTNGVNVRACFKTSDFVLADFTSDGLCPTLNSVSATLTVAGTPLSISISDDNKMEKGLGEIAYLKKFLLQVNDAAGVAVKDAVVSASVDITHFGKGAFGGTYPLGLIAPTIQDLTLGVVQDTPTTVKVITDTASNTVPSMLQVGTAVPKMFNVWCANEDKNRNGFLDTSEDTNGDSILQPRKAEIIVSYVNGNRTDANGQMLVQITYGQNMGTWLAYTLRVTTGVAGSEGDASKSYITNVLEGDVANGSFLTPPFGASACNSRF